MGASTPSSQPNKSAFRYPDGVDSDNNFRDFQLQNSISMLGASAAGSNNIKVGSVEGLINGQKVIIGAGTNSETGVIAIIGTAGGTTVGTATAVGATVIPVASAAGFAAGQTITIDNGANLETAVVASIAGGGRGGMGGGPGGGRGGQGVASITITAPLANAHAVGAQVSGSGITFATPLKKAHEAGAQVASNVPTPGEPNQYTVKKP